MSWFGCTAILILKKYPLFCRLSAGECDLHINEGDRNSSILDKIVDNCPMTNRRSHLSRSLFNRIGPKIRIAVGCIRTLDFCDAICHAHTLIRREKPWL
jgi:hypothetical protein